jgi:hypothetical protein
MKTASDRARIAVLGYIVRGPLGGLAWHHAQYVAGLSDARHEVLFLEDSGDSPFCCYDPVRGLTDDNPGYGLTFAADLFSGLGLAERWAYLDRRRNQWLGPAAPRIPDFIATADIVLNLSLANEPAHGLEVRPLRIAVDTDPVFTQIRNLTEPGRRNLTEAHNRFFTYGANLPCPDAPADGIAWRPTRQPVVLRHWPVTPGKLEAPYTTVMQWDSYSEREWGGRRYGQKSLSFQPFMDIPRRSAARLEIALGSPHAPRAELRAAGWSLKDPREAVGTPWAFQEYLRASKGEFAVAKHGYATARCGWFSDRTAAYLASGRPAVVQDTGFTDWLSAPGGVLAFRDADEAVARIEEVEADYAKHCRLAREVAEEYFEAGKVLDALLEGM